MQAHSSPKKRTELEATRGAPSQGVPPRPRASTRARFSGSASAASESYLLESMTFAHSSRAIVRYLTWIATTTSRPRRPLAYSGQGPAACGVMRPFSPGATSSWTGAASSLAVARRLRHACGWRLRSLLRELRPLPSSVPGHRTRWFVAGEPGRRCQALVPRDASRFNKKPPAPRSVNGILDPPGERVFKNKEVRATGERKKKAGCLHPQSPRRQKVCNVWPCAAALIFNASTQHISSRKHCRLRPRHRTRAACNFVILLL